MSTAYEQAKERIVWYTAQVATTEEWLRRGWIDHDRARLMILEARADYMTPPGAVTYGPLTWDMIQEDEGKR